MSACRSCGAEILWAKTIKGHSIPLDAQPAAKGNVVIAENGTALVYRDPAAIATRYVDEPHFVSHFATCPNADEHRA